ncbi:MAG: hypothetical protein HFI63_06140 [Lachnospiraceae bacterium]|nr:hypothetical protein [Lachnospiraceae bacterium]
MEEKKGLRGSYTVEAAFLIPLGIGVILFLISTALFLHDTVTACAWVHETAQWEGFQKREEESRDFSSIFLLAKVEEEVDRHGRELFISSEGEGWLFSSMLEGMFHVRKPRIEKKERVKRIFGEEAVRLRGFTEGVYTGGSDLQKGEGT